MRCITLCLVFIALFSTVANGEPTVIFDGGNTQPMPDRLQIKQPNYQNLRLPVNPRPFGTFPVSSPRLTPGIVQSRVIDRPGLDMPVFIVGYDKMSIAWIQHNRERLLNHHATGIVVNVDNQEQLNHLRQIAKGLEVNPVPGDKIAKQLELAHYPVLISRNRIEQ